MTAKAGVIPLKTVSNVGTVTSVVGVNANGFTVGVTNPTSTPTITVGTSLIGLMVGDGTAATALPFPGGTTTFLRADGTFATPAAGTGTVTSVSVVTANGLAGTVATPTSTPAITLTTSVTGVLKGNGTAISASATSDIAALLGSPTANYALLGNGTGAFQTVAPSTSGNVLTSNGSTWQSTAPAAAAPGLVLLNTTIVSSSTAAVDFTSLITSTYDEYEVHVQSAVPVTTGAFVWLRASINNGSTFLSTSGDYQYSAVANGSTIPTATGLGSTTVTALLLDAGIGVSSTASAAGFNGVATIFNPLNTNNQKSVYFTGAWYNGGVSFNVGGSGCVNNSSAVNAIRVMFSSGNIASGVFRLYGLRKTP